jgi:hypothetical protein
MTYSFNTSATNALTDPPAAHLWRLLSICLCGLVFLPAACQKQSIKIKGHELSTILAADKKHIGIPIDLPDALDGPRIVFQSRGVIILTINSDKISPIAPIELINKTTGLTLIKGQGASLNLNDEADSDGVQPSWALANAGYDFLLRIYPLDPSFAGKFAYGLNELALSVDKETSPKDAKKTITLRDFNYFAGATSMFSSNENRKNGFEGEITLLSTVAASNGGYELTNGFIGMLSR